MNTNIVGDFDPESRKLLQGIRFLDLNQIGYDGIQNERQDSLASVRGKRSFEEISNEYAMNGGFGRESLFYTAPAIKETIACRVDSKKWIYKFYQSTKGSELISDYRKYDSFLEKSEGKSDDVYDFILYIETDYTLNMGKVLLIKMSNAMIIDYLEEFKNNIDTTIVKQWSTSIYELNKSRKGFSATIDDIENAFLLEIQYRPKVNDGTIKLTNSEIVSMVPSQLSEKIREIKIDRENWDPTLKSDRYKLESLRKEVDSLSGNLTEFKTEVAYCRKFLETINLFSPLTGKNLVLEGSIQFLKSLEIGIASIIQKLKLNKKKGPEYFAFFCGIIDGIIEFICGIIDVVFLILELIFSNALKDKPEFELDFLELREGLEEFIEAWLDDPNFLDKKITEMMEAYEYSRRNDPKLNKYQIAHNNGEDLVLAIDIILSFIAIVKSLTSSSKYLPKFTEWIDEVVARNGKGALKVEEALQEAKRSKKLIGAIEYEILSDNLLKKYIDDVLNICNEKGLNLEIRWIDETHPDFGNYGLLGKLEITLDKRNLFLHLRPECPKITWYHEKKHLEDFLELGWRRYTDISKKTPWKHEQSVWDFIYKNRNRWSEPELVDAYLYYQDYIGKKSGYKLSYKLKEMEDLGKKLGLIKK